MENLGLKDQPIKDIKDESLGLREYSDFMTDFIRNCDTPLTIALQGDWGSGKTSLMNLIDNSLKSNDNNDANHFLTVRFNTWQYSQFNMSDTIALSMMSRLIDGIRKEAGDKSDLNEIFRKLEGGIKGLSTAIAISGASLIGQGDTMKEFFANLQQQGSAIEDPAMALEKLKDNLEKVVTGATSTKGKIQKKIVVFVDDLDRLVPVKAVELLEHMKIFLDIEGCVFVIACDYGVVVRGLKDKFGIAEGELKGKSFFDKIIQVPFKMPIRKYDPDSYIKKLLENCDIPFEDEDIVIYHDLVKNSVGFNPRTMKRLLNSLKLLTILDQKQLDSQNNFSSKDPDDYKRQSSRILFGTLCMLEEFEEIYDHVANHLSATDIHDLHKGLKASKEFSSLRDSLVDDQDNGDSKLDQAVEFLNTFIKSIQLDDDEKISNEEIENLAKMLSHSSLVSSSTRSSKESRIPSMASIQNRLGHQWLKLFEDMRELSSPELSFRQSTHSIRIQSKTTNGKFHLPIMMLDVWDVDSKKGIPFRFNAVRARSLYRIEHEIDWKDYLPLNAKKMIASGFGGATAEEKNAWEGFEGWYSDVVEYSPLVDLLRKYT